MKETRYEHASRDNRENGHTRKITTTTTTKVQGKNWRVQTFELKAALALAVSHSWACVPFLKENDDFFFVPYIDLAVNMVSTHCWAVLAGLMFGVSSVSLHYGLTLLWRGNATSWSKFQKSISCGVFVTDICVNKMNLNILSKLISCRIMSVWNFWFEVLSTLRRDVDQWFFHFRRMTPSFVYWPPLWAYAIHPPLVPSRFRAWAVYSGLIPSRGR